MRKLFLAFCVCFSFNVLADEDRQYPVPPEPPLQACVKGGGSFGGCFIAAFIGYLAEGNTARALPWQPPEEKK